MSRNIRIKIKIIIITPHNESLGRLWRHDSTKSPPWHSIFKLLVDADENEVLP